MGSAVASGLVFEHEEIQRILSNLCFPVEEPIPLLPKKKKKRVLVLAGPTGCGKTALSLILAKAIGGEIISADSMQVYRGMDIGTAKIRTEEQEGVPHHLIDIRNLSEGFNVVDFYYEARNACSKIHARDNIPIVVGGAGFYLRALLHGPPGGPPSVDGVRAKLESEMDVFGPDVLYERLVQHDPDYAQTITCHDRQKIIRALEIMVLTGEKVSAYTWDYYSEPRDYAFHCWFLHRPRDLLYQRIEDRCHEMLEQGLLDEVLDLEKKGLRSNLSASQSIGYRQCLNYLDSQQTNKDYEELLFRFQVSSRRYAKRQFTWFRKEPFFRWLNMEILDEENLCDIILNDLDPR